LQRPLAADDECQQCASPLFPAERYRLEYSGQRMLSRVTKSCEVALHSSWPQTLPFHGAMRDVSLNGMLVDSPLELTVNQLVKIDSEVCRALARVAHCRRAPEAVRGWLVGVEFLTLRFASKRGSFVEAEA
jgi:hypothetical protein